MRSIMGITDRLRKLEETVAWQGKAIKELQERLVPLETEKAEIDKAWDAAYGHRCIAEIMSK